VPYPFHFPEIGQLSPLMAGFDSTADTQQASADLRAHYALLRSHAGRSSSGDGGNFPAVWIGLSVPFRMWASRLSNRSSYSRPGGQSFHSSLAIIVAPVQERRPHQPPNPPPAVQGLATIQIWHISRQGARVCFARSFLRMMTGASSG
jgi:hypothetical protein